MVVFFWVNPMTVVLIRQASTLLSANAAATVARQAAEDKGWETWVEYSQSDVLAWATCVTRKPGTNWYFVAQFVEDDERVYKVLGRKDAVLERWLARCDAHVSE